MLRADCRVIRAIYDNDVIHEDAEDRRENHEIVERRHCIAAELSVNRIRRVEPHRCLDVPDRHSGTSANGVDVAAGGRHIDCGHENALLS